MNNKIARIFSYTPSAGCSYTCQLRKDLLPPDEGRVASSPPSFPPSPKASNQPKQLSWRKKDFGTGRKVRDDDLYPLKQYTIDKHTHTHTHAHTRARSQARTPHKHTPSLLRKRTRSRASRSKSPGCTPTTASTSASSRRPRAAVPQTTRGRRASTRGWRRSGAAHPPACRRGGHNRTAGGVE